MEQPPWTRPLHAAYSANRILDHSLVLTVAVLHEGQPAAYALRFRGFHSSTALLFHLDTRSQLFSALHNGVPMFLWHLPLTCEVFKFSAASLLWSTELRAEEWDSLCQKEKLSYFSLPPDSAKGENVDKLRYDIDHFAPQGTDCISSHFAVLEMSPACVDQAKYLDKSAIGNTRKTFESLPQPECSGRRWLHSLQDGLWTTSELNAPTLP